MRTLNYLNLLFCISILLLLGCKSNSLTPLTKSTIKEYKLSKTELQQLQFYTSDKIVLVKINQNASVSISDGALSKSRNRNIDEIVIDANTPGIVKSVNAKNHLEVNFDSNNPDCVLLFGPNPKRRNQYVLLAKEWNRQTGVIPYCGESYRTSTENSKVTLLLSTKSDSATKVKRTKVQGAKVND